jgi:PhzF family phenazine biosynthesis protein
MSTLPLFQVDAFADRPFTGNPAAVIPLGAWLADDVLQAIAAENNLSETAYTVPADGDADYELRWFTPTSEVVMCGHATLASGHVLLRPDQERIRFATRKAGILEVGRDGDGYALSLPAWVPIARPLPEVAAALELDSDAVVETLWHENHYGVIVVRDEAAVRACAPDFRKLAQSGDWLTIVTARGDTAEVVSRAFAPGAGIDEDPVTGSAHAVIATYWAEKLGRTRFSAYQASARGGHLTCSVEGDRIVLGGRCVTVIEGQLRI